MESATWKPGCPPELHRGGPGLPCFLGNDPIFLWCSTLLFYNCMLSICWTTFSSPVSAWILRWFCCWAAVVRYRCMNAPVWLPWCYGLKVALRPSGKWPTVLNETLCGSLGGSPISTCCECRTFSEDSNSFKSKTPTRMCWNLPPVVGKVSGLNRGDCLA